MLPPLREDIDLHPGPKQRDGQPAWVLQDPARNHFFQIDWLTFEILSRWSLGDASIIISSIRTATTLHPSEEDVATVQKFLEDNQLLHVAGGLASAQAGEFLRRKGQWRDRILHNYLFFRVPLIRPDRFLENILPRISFLLSQKFLFLTFGAFLLALFGIAQEWEKFKATLVDTISLEGVMAYAIAIMSVKIAHEFGHALMAKKFGCRVPTMGVAFLVMWPVAYTDTSDVWKLVNRNQRLMVASAGVATELIIAIWCAFLWVFLPDGYLRSVMFVLATISWVGTFLINLNPFTRFDGYYLLCDWLNIPNLHQRSFAMARWDLRERLFDLQEAPPEHFPASKRCFLIIFAWMTWIYRLVLFLGIAVLVYHFFIKLFGIFLFLVEIIWFVLMPVRNELREWVKRWSIIRTHERIKRTAIILSTLFIFVCLPLPGHVITTGMLHPTNKIVFHAPRAAQVNEILIKESDNVKEGDVVLKLSSPQLELKLAKASLKIKKLEWQLGSAGLDGDMLGNILLYRQSLAAAKEERQSIIAEIAQLSLIAPFSGQLRDVGLNLKVGQWIQVGEPLGTLINKSQWVVETYLDESAVRRVQVGNNARFINKETGEVISLRVATIDNDATRVLSDGVYALQNGGSVMVRERNGQYIPDHAIYRVRLTADHPGEIAVDYNLQGKIIINASYEALMLPYVHQVLSVAWRELGF